MRSLTLTILSDRYTSAIFLATKTSKQCRFLMTEPGHYTVYRCANVESFESGVQSGAPFGLRSMDDVNETNVLKALTHKSLCQAVEIDIAMCYVAMGGGGEMSKENFAAARQHLKQATSSKSWFELAPLIAESFLTTITFSRPRRSQEAHAFRHARPRIGRSQGGIPRACRHAPSGQQEACLRIYQASSTRTLNTNKIPSDGISSSSIPLKQYSRCIHALPFLPSPRRPPFNSQYLC